jgi:hypothetical protein
MEPQRDLILDNLGPARVLEGKWYAPGSVAGYTLGKRMHIAASFPIKANSELVALGNLPPKNVQVITKKAVPLVRKTQFYST